MEGKDGSEDGSKDKSKDESNEKSLPAVLKKKIDLLIFKSSSHQGTTSSESLLVIHYAFRPTSTAGHPLPGECFTPSDSFRATRSEWLISNDSFRVIHSRWPKWLPDPLKKTSLRSWSFFRFKIFFCNSFCRFIVFLISLSPFALIVFLLTLSPPS